MAAYHWRDDLVTCRLTAYTPGSALGPTLGNEYWEAFTFTFYLQELTLFLCWLVTTNCCTFAVRCTGKYITDWGQCTGECNRHVSNSVCSATKDCLVRCLSDDLLYRCCKDTELEYCLQLVVFNIAFISVMSHCGQCSEHVSNLPVCQVFFMHFCLAVIKL